MVSKVQRVDFKATKNSSAPKKEKELQAGSDKQYLLSSAQLAFGDLVNTLDNKDIRKTKKVLEQESEEITKLVRQLEADMSGDPIKALAKQLKLSKAETDKFVSCISDSMKELAHEINTNPELKNDHSTDGKTSSQLLCDSISHLAVMMQEMQIEISKGLNNKLAADALIGNAFHTMFTKNSDEDHKQYVKAHHHHHSFWSIFKKVGEALASAGLIVGSVFNPALIGPAIAMTALTIASETGGMHAALEGIAKGLHSKILAALIMTVVIVVIVATAAALGPAALVEAGEVGAEAAGDLAAEGAEGALEGLGTEGADAADVAATGGEEGSGAEEATKATKAARRGFRYGLKASAPIAGSMIASTNLFVAIINKMGGKDKMWAQILGQALQLVAAIALAVYGGMATSGGEGFASSGALAKLQLLAPTMMSMGMISSGAAGIGSGVDQIKTGKDLKKLAPIEKALVELDTAIKQVQQSQKRTSATQKNLAKGFADETQAIGKMLAGLDAEVQLVQAFV